MIMTEDFFQSKKFKFKGFLLQHIQWGKKLSYFFKPKAKKNII
jgi:hypothetical protein